MIASHHTDHCRVCGSAHLHLVLDLGSTALANSFRKPESSLPEPMFPLRLVICEDCGLVQIDETIPPEVLFRDYVYVSGTSDLIHRHAANLADRYTSRYHLTSSDLVLELASNDGTVLRAFQEYGMRVLGVEPARNIAERAIASGIPTVPEFFHLATARAIHEADGPAKLIIARHVLAHVAELHSFVEGVAHCLATDGVAVFEVPHLLPFFEKLEYDTVYHEHLCYWSVGVLQKLGMMHGLQLINVEEVAIHGGSVLVTFQRSDGLFAVEPSVGLMIAKEDAIGLRKVGAWQSFAKKAELNRSLLYAELMRLKSNGKRVVGYGAAAKGMTLLAYSGVGPSMIEYIADRSPFKQGLLTPGHHIPVVPAERLLQDQPDVVLILAWNFAEEVIRQQAEYERRGGRFLLPLPEPRYANGPKLAAA